MLTGTCNVLFKLNSIYVWNKYDFCICSSVNSLIYLNESMIKLYFYINTIINTIENTFWTCIIISFAIYNFVVNNSWWKIGHCFATYKIVYTLVQLVHACSKDMRALSTEHWTLNTEHWINNFVNLLQAIALQLFSLIKRNVTCKSYYNHHLSWNHWTIQCS